MTINLTDLEFLISEQVSSVTDREQLLIYSKILSKLKNQWVSTVDAVADLPDATGVEGEIYYVIDTNTVYYSNGTEWISLKEAAGGGSLYLWGNAYDLTVGFIGDETPVPYFWAEFDDWTQFDLSKFGCHEMGIRSDGTLWAWGDGSNGKLGNNSYSYSQSPVSVVGGFTDWCQVSAGPQHTAAVRANGTLWTWGRESYGRLGNNEGGSYTAKSSPVSVVGGFTDWCQVSAGYQHTAAVRENGTLWTWGLSSNGQLGDGTITDQSSPVSVIGGFTDWCQVGAGCKHNAAIRENGTLWAWGRNQCGRLGDGTITDQSSPVSVVGGFTDWCQVSAGSYNTAAIRENGTLWTWGAVYAGRLGNNNNNTNKSSPVSVVGGFTDWCQVSIGEATSVALRTDGTAWMWGGNSDFQIRAAYSNFSSPVSVLGNHLDWISVAISNNVVSGLRAEN